MIGKALKLIRMYHGLSQIELSNDIGYSCSMICVVESGKRNVSLDLINKYSEYFKMNASSIIYLSELLRNLEIKSDGNKAMEIFEWKEKFLKGDI